VEVETSVRWEEGGLACRARGELTHDVCFFRVVRGAEVEAERADPFKVLERGGEDRRAAADAKPRLEQLQDMGDARSDSYSLNKALRRQHRTQRKEAAATLAEGRAVGLPDHIQLLPPSATDAATAAAVFGGAASAAAAASCPFEAMRKVSARVGVRRRSHTAPGRQYHR
jgi:hypothetical protein